MITININSIDRSGIVIWSSVKVIQNLTYLVDTASFSIRKYGDRTYTPAYNDDIIIYNGSEKIFAGKILTVAEGVESAAGGVAYKVECVDHTYEFDKLLVSKTYTSETIEDIIDDIVANFTTAGSGFTTDNANVDIEVDKIVFNQITPSECLKRLATLLQYDWYIDEDKDIHFFSKETNSAPYNLTDTSGNYIATSLKRNIDGTQLVNQVKVRGGTYEGATFTDSLTVSGDDSLSFTLPYQFSNLTVSVNSVAQTIGIDFVDDFTSFDVLHNFQEKTIRFETALSDGDIIEFSGNPSVRVFAIAQDSVSAVEYGIIEKLIRDNSISDNTIARRRAYAELLYYSQEIVDAQFSTYDSGLRTGMQINIQSDKRDSNDSLIIKQAIFTVIDPENFIYKVQCVTTRRLDFIELLQKIVEAEPQSIDETETSEQIYAANEEMNFGEVIELTTPQDVDETMTFNEDTRLDPVDPANVNFVYAPYAPTSFTDVKRAAKYDRAAVYK